MPGWEAHAALSPIFKTKSSFPLPPENAKISAVMAILTERDEEPGFVLIVRSSKVKKDSHRGQLGFPGGRSEEADTTLLATAIRETEEEIGVSKKELEILGPLSPIYIPVSNYRVQPFCAYAKGDLKFTLQESEVDSVQFLPIDTVVNQTIKTTALHSSYGMKIKNVPYFPLNDLKVWGATAMMLNEIGTILRKQLNTSNH